jgi:hypothetical protein
LSINANLSDNSLRKKDPSHDYQYFFHNVKFVNSNLKKIPKNKKSFLGIKSGAEGSEVELF